MGNEYRRDDGAGPAVAARSADESPITVDVGPVVDPLDLLGRWDGGRAGHRDRRHAFGRNARDGAGGRPDRAELVRRRRRAPTESGLRGVLRLAQALDQAPSRVIVIGDRGRRVRDGHGPQSGRRRRRPGRRPERGRTDQGVPGMCMSRLHRVLRRTRDRASSKSRTSTEPSHRVSLLALDGPEPAPGSGSSSTAGTPSTGSTRARRRRWRASCGWVPPPQPASSVTRPRHDLRGRTGRGPPSSTSGTLRARTCALRTLRLPPQRARLLRTRRLRRSPRHGVGGRATSGD